MNSSFNLGNTKTRKSKEKPFHYNWFICNKRWKLVLQHVSQHKPLCQEATVLIQLSIPS
jgi:hypothetical protein